MIFIIVYVVAGVAGLAVGRIAFPGFFRAFVKYQFRRMLKKEERERKRDLAYEHGFYLADDSPPVGVTERPPPPPPPRLPEASETLGGSRWQQSRRHKPEVVEIHEFGTKDPVAYVRVADGALVEQMVCPECYMGYDYKVEARHYIPGSVPDQIPPDAPKCKHCNGKGRLSVTRF